MKKLAICLAAVLCVCVSFESAFAQKQPGSKSSAVVTRLNYLASSTLDNSGADEWQTIMQNSLRTSEHKDIFVDVSLECGLYTRTLVKSKGGAKDTSIASATIKVRVLVDGVPALPDEVTFAARTQELSAVFQGLLEGEDGETCLTADLETGAIFIDDECLLPEELELILDTMGAHSFNFLMGDVESGVHSVEVQAKIEIDTSALEGDAEARATIGNGSVTIDEVRMIKGEDYEL